MNDNIWLSPTMFSWKILGIKPLRYQAEILEDEKNLLIIGGRKIGKSTMLAIKALWTALVMNSQDVLIVSRAQRQADIVFNKIYDFCTFNEFIKPHVHKLTQSEVKFDNASVIRSLPSGHSGETIRGFSSSIVMFDEAGFIPDEVFTAVLPALAVAGQQIILSGTPYGKRGFFYNTYITQSARGNKGTWDIYKIRATDTPLITKEFLNEMRLSLTADEYMQEFEAEFMDETNAYFPHSLVFTCLRDYDYFLPTKTDKEYEMGVDVARLGSDETAIVLVENEDDGNKRVIWTKTLSQKELTEVAGEIIQLAHQIPNLKAIYMDETGVGGGLVDMVKEKLHGLVRGIVFTTKRRMKMYTQLKLRMEQHKLNLNMDDRKMIVQFGNYTSRYQSDGKLTVIKGAGHDDVTDALALVFADDYSGEVEVLEGWNLSPFARQESDVFNLRM